MLTSIFSRPKILTSTLLVGTILLLSGCVEFKKMSLYSGEETVAAPAKPDKISLVVEPVIFEEDATDVWGLETTVCKEASLSTDVTYDGDAALMMSWDRGKEGCEWAGIGIGWDSYAGKDISEILDYVAIEMQVRSQKGKMFGLPIVLTLEDYSGGMGFSYTGNKYFERPFIDEEWQKVVVPLNTFDMEVENLDPTNIKQLMFELQQSGSIYLDEVKLVFYEEQPQEPWLVEAPLPDPLKMPKQLFDDAFINNNGWGLLKDDCQDFKLSTSEKATGNQSIHASWNDPNGDCKNVTIGVSWNKWFPVDIRSVIKTTKVSFKIKMARGSASQLPIGIAFEDYDRANSQSAMLTSDYVIGGTYDTEWRQVEVPFSAFSKGVKQDNIKQLLFKFSGQGEVFIDDVRLLQTN